MDFHIIQQVIYGFERVNEMDDRLQSVGQMRNDVEMELQMVKKSVMTLTISKMMGVCQPVLQVLQIQSVGMDCKRLEKHVMMETL
jgi:hypothetical protein